MEQFEIGLPHYIKNKSPISNLSFPLYIWGFLRFAQKLGIGSNLGYSRGLE